MEALEQALPLILAILIPGGLIIAMANLVFKQMLKRQQTQERYKIRTQAFSEIIPLKVQAYERAMLYLERIDPVNLIARLPVNELKVVDLHKAMIENITTEYEHNAVQQIYVSEEGWALLLRAKSELTTVVNQSAQGLKPNDPGIKLVEHIQERIKDDELELTRPAVKQLRRDVRNLFA